MRYSGPPSSSFFPPPCGAPARLVSWNRLNAGFAGKIRDAGLGRDRVKVGKSLSYASSESWKLFCPRAFAVAAPALHPKRVKIGWMSRRTSASLVPRRERESANARKSTRKQESESLRVGWGAKGRFLGG